jgi:protocatechuate 3,4-dioxygenase, alpha subunit
LSTRDRSARLLEPTPWCTVGPYFSVCVNEDLCVPKIAAPGVKGERVKLIFTVLDRDGACVPDTLIEIWQANADGKYNHPDDRQAKAIDPEFRGFGRQITDENGACEFDTIRPGRVPGRGKSLQAPHLEVGVFTRGVLKHLATRIYFSGDAANPECPVLALVPKARRATLMAQPVAGQPGTWRHEIHLSGPKETVFFDV